MLFERIDSNFTELQDTLHYDRVLLSVTRNLKKSHQSLEQFRLAAILGVKFSMRF